ncbi:DUF4270 domain-containing protein [Flavobacterium sp.]|uniref:DUF4270 domain-containing protein n=1 Tax=Flavobacterium sp. TaxID=239 RepID=UPI002FDDD0E9
MFKKSYLLQGFFGLTAVVLLASCDKDFNELGTDIVGDDHFGFVKYTDVGIQSYNQKLGPIASNNLPINPLGFYDNPVYGTTQANFVTQVELPTSVPTFNNTDPDEYDTEPTKIDSVILNIPYFSTLQSDLDENDNKVYKLDSIYGISESKFKLSIYQSNFYLRDLDPDQSFTGQQLFYTDKDAEIDSYKVPVLLNDAPLTGNNADGHENTAFFFDKREHKTTALNEDGEEVETRSVPSMRLHLNKQVFTDLILNAPSGQLANNSVFKNYFRGLYFKTESLGNPGNMAMINFKGGSITIYYNEDKATTTNGTTTYQRVNKNMVLTLNGNTVSLLNNSNENANYLAAANSAQEASRLYLKGGQGSIAVIDIFNQADTYRYDRKLDGNGNPVSDAKGNPIYIRVNTPNGVSDELDDLRYPAVDNTGIDRSTKNRWMINEANLTFYIDRDIMSNPAQTIKPVEPNRIFLYDLTNKKVLIDYTYDFTSNTIRPKNNKYIHGGIIEREQVTNGRGQRYKIRLTSHLRNLITKDSTNVRLGLAVTETINNVAFSKLRTANTNTNSAPSMSVLSPLGTVLYGTNIPVGDENYDKRLKLEIYYTKPE